MKKKLKFLNKLSTSALSRFPLNKKPYEKKFGMWDIDRVTQGVRFMWELHS